MRALPWPDWLRSAARRLRELAERLESPSRLPSEGPDGGTRPGAPGTEGAATVGMTRPTPVRTLDMSGAPEHWVKLLRDAGLAPEATPEPPDAGSH
ncbi:MAG TPA: hypothetical protein VJQ60_11720, partial [Arthrobacter sp.]|nr:hypothetical protein [Arthrobacter sp.]